MMAIPGVRPVVAAGWLVATLTGAGLGAPSGLLGSLVHAGVREDQAHTDAGGVRRGRTLVTVRSDDSQVTTIAMVLAGRTAQAVDPADLRAGGWNGYADTASLCTAESVTA